MSVSVTFESTRLVTDPQPSFGLSGSFPRNQYPTQNDPGDTPVLFPDYQSLHPRSARGRRETDPPGRLQRREETRE